jgi:hypothetical protein
MIYVFRDPYLSCLLSRGKPNSLIRREGIVRLRYSTSAGVVGRFFVYKNVVMYKAAVPYHHAKCPSVLVLHFFLVQHNVTQNCFAVQ